MADNFWNLGNTIVGFCIVQMLIFLYTLAGGSREMCDRIFESYIGVMCGIAGSGFVYCFIVGGCFYAEAEFRKNSSHKPIILKWSYRLFWVRISLIMLITIAGISILYRYKEGHVAA